ncbi:hypothetical protein L596_005059 [Steinernema carpocapsae]|uniref:JmjC domain-containing protein n=1 Tax=Steinernema carpocapsae TaxID=34508 RepID=A0A4U8UXW0_STECR|nr:hypothetical protein L596_005059 [Steinernema carpocapsae]
MSSAGRERSADLLPKQRAAQRLWLPRAWRRAQNAKKAARPELDNVGWSVHGLAYIVDMEPLATRYPDNIGRIDGRVVSHAEFAERYEWPRKPTIITGLIDNWRASHKWDFDRLERKYRNQLFKCGEDDSGCSVKLKMKYYMTYMFKNYDDSPLCIFDGSFGERHKTKRLLDDYVVPPYFQDDLFSYVSSKRRPPYRWFVMGPARSGTGIHIDPLGTSAWNGLVKGRKKWVLIPPNVPKALLKPPSEISKYHPDEAITWFLNVYPKLHLETNKVPFYECVQHPGEIMFVPSGWWHVVINLDNTIAVTQNFCSLNNLEYVWRKTKRSRPKMFRQWIEQLRSHRPDAVRVLDRLQFNEESGREHSSSSNESSSSSSSSDSDSSSSDSDSESDSDENVGHGLNKNESQSKKSPTAPRDPVVTRKRRGDCSHDESECLCKLHRSP